MAARAPTRRAMNALARYLRDNRIRQVDFAHRLGVTQSTVSKLCRPGVSIRSDTMLRIESLTGGAVPAASWITKESCSSSEAA
jgi:plasmid maintenance system antidote protein VapI